MESKCLECGVKYEKLSSSLRCELCRVIYRKNNLQVYETTSQEEIDKIRELSTSHTVKQIAEILNKKVYIMANIGKNEKIKFRYFYNRYNPQEVFDYYKTHTTEETLKRFPNIKCISSYFRYRKEFKPNKKHITTDQEKIFMVKAAGILHSKSIAKHLGLNYSTFSTKFYTKNKITIRGFHGLKSSERKKYLIKSAPIITTQLGGVRGNMKIILWVDAIEHLKPDCPEFVKNIFEAKAQFQMWLFNGKPREEITRMLKEINYE